MLTAFKNYVKERKLFQKNDVVLLGVSGGLDSVVMSELFHRAGFHFAIAHCNFKLRGKESDADARFVAELSQKYNVPLFSKKFETKEYAKSNGISLQMAARELRYAWFEEILTKHGFRCLSIATQSDDQAETMLVNLIRGTGIAGLHGIYPSRGKIIRPLLFATRSELLKFAAEHTLNWREDSSNRSDKYVRNKIRHKIIPVLKEINSDLELTLAKTAERLRQTEEIFNQRIEEIRKKTVLPYTGNKDKAVISIKRLVQLHPLQTYLYEFLKNYGFKEVVIDEIISCLHSQPGRQFYSDTHIVYKDRQTLIISRKRSGMEDETKFIHKNTREIRQPAAVKFEIADIKKCSISKDETIAFLDYDSLHFPLVFRKWKQGDAFVPLGMKGRKKISDFLIDKKVPMDQKEDICVLVSMGEVVWIAGHRIDNRYKITSETKKVFIAKL